uniref:INPP5B_0 protein n=1 Tax=Fopius arisanus TaxID=64838 RepID=A0A0C9RXA2_9HYME
MVMSEAEDRLTQINTALNRSMVLMEESARSSPKPKDKRSRKSITINTTAVKATSTPLQENTIRKSILKRKETEKNEETPLTGSLSFSNGWNPESTEENTHKAVDRPHNLEELVSMEQLVVDSTSQTYTLEDVDPDDELWIIDVPKSVEPLELQGQILHLGAKTKMKIGQEKYQATSHDTSDCLTCVFGTGRDDKPFKIVNIRPSGTVTMRRRLTSVAKACLGADIAKNPVPFPKGIKPRDPLAGVSLNGKVKKKSKSRLKKLDGLD